MDSFLFSGSLQGGIKLFNEICLRRNKFMEVNPVSQGAKVAC